jgi:hypothetical protein
MGQGSIREIFTSLSNTWLAYLALQISIILRGSRGKLHIEALGCPTLEELLI